MDPLAISANADRRRLVWCTLFASLYKFETRCTPSEARRTAAAAFERLGAGEPFSAVQSMLRGDLNWPANPDEH